MSATVSDRALRTDWRMLSELARAISDELGHEFTLSPQPDGTVRVFRRANGSPEQALTHAVPVSQAFAVLWAMRVGYHLAERDTLASERERALFNLVRYFGELPPELRQRAGLAQAYQNAVKLCSTRRVPRDH